MTEEMASSSIAECDPWLLGLMSSAMLPDPKLTVSEWAEQHRILTEKTSSEPGPWRTSRIPFIKEIMDALSVSSPYEEVVFMKGTQIGGTEAGLNFLGYIIDQAPGPAMCVMPTVDTMKDNSRLRIDPMIDDCPRLKGKVAEAKSRDGSNTMLLKEFPGGFLSMVGANAPAALRSKPARYGFADEIDLYPGDVGGEGDPISLFRRAFRNFPGRKIFLCSSPRTAGNSRIEDVFSQTDRRRYYLPCVHCGGFQILKWANLHWEKNAPETAYYVCEHCGAVLYNHDKTEMLARGEWRPDVSDYRGRRIGFHLSALYSPVGWFSWSDAAKQFLEAKKDVNKLKAFVNQTLGEPWEERGEAPEWERLYYRREDYPKNQVPAGGLFLTAGVDVQKDYVVVEIVAWGRDKESWSLDWRAFPGDTANLNGKPYQMLDSLLAEGFVHEYGNILHIRCLAIDTGFNTQAVYNWARRYPANRVMPVKGEHLPTILGHPRPVDVYFDGTRAKHAVKLWGVGSSHLKSELYGWLRLPAPEQGESHPAGFCHFPEYEEEYFRQLTSEELVKHESRTGQITYEWVRTRDQNHTLDCRIYARAAAALLQIDRLQTQHWDRIERGVCGDRQKASARPKAEDGIRADPDARSTHGRPGRGRILSRGVQV